LKPLVLVIEDDREYADRFIRHLGDLGAKGFRAETFVDALKLLRTRPEFDGVIADVMVPTKKGKTPTSRGIDFVRKIKQENRDIPTFLYSSNFSPSDFDKLEGEGICENYASREELDQNEGGNRFEFVQKLLACAKNFSSKREAIGKAFHEKMDAANLEDLRYGNDEQITSVVDDGIHIEVLQNEDFDQIIPKDDHTDKVLKRPIPIWIVRRANNLYSAEVYRANTIRAFGKSEEEARKNLAKILKHAIISIFNPATTIHGATGLTNEAIMFLRPYIRNSSHD